MSRWEPDVLPGYWQQTIPLGLDPDGEGELVATLVRRGDGDRPARPCSPCTATPTTSSTPSWPITSLRAASRSTPSTCTSAAGRDFHGQTPHFTTNLASYDAELDRSLSLIAADTAGAQVCMYGHSAGGLIVTLWLDRLRSRGGIAARNIGALVLNSPFFDLHGPAVLRTAPTSAALIALARLRKLHVIRKPTPGGYGTSLHRDYSGEFDYNLDWKPLGGFPVTFGWINAMRRGQTRLHRGLDVGVPNLILRSDHSVPESPDPAAIQRGDAVLDVAQIARWSGCVGNHTTVAPITDAKHDVFLSLPEPRAAAFRELDAWLDHHWSFDGETLPTSTRSGQG